MPAATSIRLAPELRTRAAAVAYRLGLSLNGIVAVALAEYLLRHERRERREDAAPVADVQPVQQAPAPKIKPRSSEPCWCGSGRKYRDCHFGRDRRAS